MKTKTAVKRHVIQQKKSAISSSANNVRIFSAFRFRLSAFRCVRCRLTARRVGDIF